jgi:hypothetical protein
VPFRQLKTKLMCRLAGFVRRFSRRWILRIVERNYPTHFRRNFKQELQALSGKVRCTELNARKSSSRSANRLHQIDDDRIRPCHKDNWCPLRSPLGRHADRRGKRIDQCNLLLLQASGLLLHGFQLTVHIADVQNELLTLLESEVFKTFPQSLDNLVPGAALQNDAYLANLSSLGVSGIHRE